MHLLLSLIAGIVQGVTEFLPISSTAHLTLFGHAFGLINEQRPQEWTAIIAVIQLGTLVAVLVYFWRDILRITGAFVHENILRPRRVTDQSGASKMGWMVAIGTIPVLVFGFLLQDVIEGPWTKDLMVIAVSQIIFALLLLVAERMGRRTRPESAIGWKDALLIGFGQAFALIPGASRSGTTMTAALFAGFARPDAARFSFLLSIPAVLLSGIFAFFSMLPFLTTAILLSSVIGIAGAFISGYASIAFLLQFLQTHTMNSFAAYRIALGVVILVGLLFF